MANSCSLIITDDDADDAMLLKDSLVAGSFRGKIEMAENGEVLLAMLKGNGTRPYLPDLILLDLNMPLVNGYDVLKELKDNQQLQSIPTVVITSSHNKKDEALCVELGCRAFFRKPYNLKGFNELANEIVGMMRKANSFC